MHRYTLVLSGMRFHHFRSLLSVAVIVGAWAFTLPCSAELPEPAERVNFQRDVRPLFEAACISCHGPRKQEGGFRLDAREHFFQGGDSGPPLVSGKSGDSDLIQRVARLDKDLAMPPDDSLAFSDEQIAKLRAWIDRGSPWPEGFVLQEREAARLTSTQMAMLPDPVARTVDFVQEVQPIFVAHCYGCHGPEHQESGLRLDHKATVIRGGDLGKTLVPGDSAASLLLHFIGGFRPEGRMPKDGQALADEQLAILRAWIDQGAAWPDSASVELLAGGEHWAFQSPVKVALPRVSADSFATAHPIDAFIGTRLQQEGLAFAPVADKATLLRRLSLDLIGLPPTIPEQDRFLSDTSPRAYQRLIERLLESPHYGERWGRHWLDAARYADSDGYEKDKPRIAHFYRDWVIRAFNHDVPYDQFIVEQIAGDLLPHATQDQIVATGYLRNSMLNEEGGIDPEQFRMEAMFDRMDAIGKGILALGLNCCQCHSHKYDPISQEEYYRLFAFLNNDDEAQLRVYTPEEMMRRADVVRQMRAIEQDLQHVIPDWQERMAAWEDQWHAQPEPDWVVVRPEVDKNATGGQRYLSLEDGSIMTAGFQPTKSVGVLHLENDIAGITGFRLEMLNDPNLPAGGPGRSFMGTFGLSEFQVEVTPADGKGTSEKVAFVQATADLSAAIETPVHPNFNEKKPVARFFGPAQYAIDGDDNTAWSSDLGPGRRNLPSTAVFALDSEHPLPVGKLTFKLVQKIGGWNADDLHAAQLGRFRISVTTSDRPDADSVPAPVIAALRVPRSQRGPTQNATIFSFWRTVAEDANPELAERLAAANREIEELWQQYPEGTTQFTLSPRDEPRLTSVLKRGEWLKPGQAVQPGTPSALHPLPADADASRLSLARWLVDPHSPTTARAVVNRVWQAYFGTGLVSTSEDFGSQGATPSHPELLDWMAVDFMEQGWSLKKLHRLIVTSRTYRQSSRVTPELLERDPNNRLLARGPRFRVEGEVVRDIQLAVSGLLNLKIGGRAVMPPAPEFLFQPPASYAPFPWKTETGDERYRRAVYTWRRRTTPYPFLQTFDTPEGNVACIRRTRANTPLQALMALNETVSMDAARAFAQRILVEGGTTESSRIQHAFRLALCRQAANDEMSLLTELIGKQYQRVSVGTLDPWQVATGSSDPNPELLPRGATPAQLAAYTQLARVLLNLDETITKE